MKRTGALLAVALLLGACAQVRDITGGPKDEAAPILVNAIPPDGTTSFTGDRFVLRFDERIQLERSRDGLLVSPPIDPPPTIAITGPREVEVRWKGELKPDATYTFAIGESVKDLTEGNRANGLAYVLSTGAALDSLMLTGRVGEAFSGTPAEGVKVMLLPEGDTAAFTGGRPAYATRTDKQGRFTLSHLPPGRFHAVALRDQNGNHRYDLPTEEIAFLPGLVTPHPPLDTSAAPLLLRLFREASAAQQVREASVTDDRAWRLILARPAETIALHDVERTGGRITWTPEWNATRDTVLMWPSDTTALDQGRYAVTTETGILDTLRYLPLRPMPFKLVLRNATREADGAFSVTLTAARPIAAWDPDRFDLRIDSAAAPARIVADSGSVRRLRIEADLPPGANALLTLLPKAVTDRYGATNDSLRFTLGRAEARSLGTLRVTVASAGAPMDRLILQLLDAQGRIVREARGVSAGDRITWERLEPGNHAMRLIEDSDGNGRWDPGQWRTVRQPEQVWHHAEPINVRAGWDLGIEWKLSAD